MGDYNPNDPVNATTQNEGFLEYLYTVDKQAYPPLVQSLSYGDQEAEIFNTTHNGSYEYGTRCNEEFMQMGLRGLTVVFSSGDDGIGSSIIRKNKALACEHGKEMRL
jgi:tripeptidyl-peptidase-1